MSGLRFFRRHRLLAAACLLAGGLLLAPAARAQGAGETAWRAAVEQAVRARLAADAAAVSGNRAAPASRVQIDIGRPDPRLPAPPCAEVEAFIPPGARLDSGRFSAGLRCAARGAASGLASVAASGAASAASAAFTAGQAVPSVAATPPAGNWTLYLPVTLKRFAPVAVAARNLPAGTPLAAADIAVEERELTPLGNAAIIDPAALPGRSFTRAFMAGQPLLSSALRREPVVAPGETVQVVASGSGFAIRAEGMALDLAEAGQPVRVRLENGARVQGTARAGHLVELQY